MMQHGEGKAIVVLAALVAWSLEHAATTAVAGHVLILLG